MGEGRNTLPDIEVIDARGIQKLLFTVFTPLALTFLVSYSVLQFGWGSTRMGTLYMLATAVLITNLIAFRYHKRLQLAMNVFLMTGPIVLLPWQVTGTFGGAVVLWFIAYIVFAMTFGGKQLGTKWLAVTYIASLTITLLDTEGGLDQHLPRELVIQFYLASLTIYLLILVFLRTRDQVDVQLREQTTRLEQAQALAGMGNWEWDIVHNRITWSKGLYKIFDISPSRHPIKYETYLDVVYEKDKALVDDAIRHTLKSFEPYATEHRIKLKDGNLRWIRAQGRVILDTHRRPVRMVGAAQDITDKKETELKQEAQTKELQNINDIMVGRELKMIELKREINELKKRLS